MAAANKTRRRGNTVSPNVKDLKDLSQQGRAAEALLENHTLNKALNEMRKNAMDRISASGLDEGVLREDMYRLIKSIDSLEAMLKKYINKGANAAFKLEEKANG